MYIYNRLLEVVELLVDLIIVNLHESVGRGTGQTKQCIRIRIRIKNILLKINRVILFKIYRFLVNLKI